MDAVCEEIRNRNELAKQWCWRLKFCDVVNELKTKPPDLKINLLAENTEHQEKEKKKKKRKWYYLYMY